MVRSEKLALAEIKKQERIALAKLKGTQRIQLKQAGTTKKRFAGLLRGPKPAPRLSAEQEMLGEMFGSGRTWGTGESLPVIRGELRSGNGIIKTGSGDDTAEMFGLT